MRGGSGGVRRCTNWGMARFADSGKLRVECRLGGLKGKKIVSLTTELAFSEALARLRYDWIIGRSKKWEYPLVSGLLAYRRVRCSGAKTYLNIEHRKSGFKPCLSGFLDLGIIP